MNPSAVQANGLINVGAAPLTVPQDLAASATVAANTTSSSTSADLSGSSASSGSSVSSGSSPSMAANMQSNGVGRRAVSGGLVSAAVLASVYLSL